MVYLLIFLLFHTILPHVLNGDGEVAVQSKTVLQPDNLKKLKVNCEDYVKPLLLVLRTR
jgi:hypothetical protein